jgi:hypothetical protein
MFPNAFLARKDFISDLISKRGTKGHMKLQGPESALGFSPQLVIRFRNHDTCFSFS